MNIRQKYEMAMLSAYGAVSMTKMAEMFSVNLRTVRYDIRILNDFLFREMGKACIRVMNKTALVDEEVRDRMAGAAQLGTKDFYANRLTGHERMLMIVFDLCWSARWSTIRDISDKYFVSRTTVNGDMAAVKSYCSKNNIRLISQRGKGSCIDAGEEERRRYLSKVIRDFTALCADRGSYELPVYSQWFEADNLEKVKCIVTEAEETFSTYLDDIAYEALVIHIALCIERFKIKTDNGEMKQTGRIEEDSPQYRMAFYIVRHVNEVFGICLTEAETGYVAMHLGARSGALMWREKYGDVLLEFYCTKAIAGVSRTIHYDFTGDKHLHDSLIWHMAACFYRRKNSLLLENPLKEELIHNYWELYQAIRTEFLGEGSLDLILPTDDEISYILLHFAAAVKRREENRPGTINVAVVCATGIGTAELVVTGLNRNFKLNIMGTVAGHQLDQFLKRENVDLIITTVPLQTTKAFVQVSPLLKRDDIVRITNQILDMGFDAGQSIMPGADSNTARQLRHLLELYSSEENENVLLRELRRLSEGTKKEKVKGEYMLSDFINEKSIRLDVACGNWEEAVKKAGQILIAKGAITGDYVQAVIDNVNEAGPYIVITKGVALPHATNKIGVNSTAMSLIRLHQPVPFGSKANDPVRYVFMLATVDAVSHLGALQDLAEFLGRNEFIHILDSAVSTDQIVSYIKNNETAS